MESVTPGLQDRVQQAKPEGNALGCYPVQNTASRYVAPLSHFVRDQLITPVSVLISMNHYGPVVTKIDRLSGFTYHYHY